MSLIKIALVSFVALCGFGVVCSSSNEALAASGAQGVKSQAAAPSLKKTQRFAAHARLQPAGLRKVTTCRETATEFRCATEFTK